MPQDNTLGAPTEGLGQTVTFAGGRSGGVPQTQAGQRQALRNNASGGGAQLTARALQVPDAQPDPTFQVLARLGGEAIKPHLEAERTAAYVQGMQKAASGQAIQEIVDEQPWYSKLFGSTSLVDGARAYTAAAKANSVAVDIETNMPELRKLSAEEFGQYATSAITKANTGDAATDMMLSQQLSSSLPAVMKAHTKAHLLYKNEVLGESIENATDKALALLWTQDSQSRDPDTAKDDNDVLGAGLEVLKVLTPPATMGVEQFDKIVARSAAKAIANGNFAALDMLETSKRYESFTPEQQKAIQAAATKARANAAMKLPVEFADDLVKLRRLSNDPNAKTDDIKAAAEAYNKKYTQHTGDRRPPIGMLDVARELEQWQANQDRLLAKAAEETEKAAKGAAKDAAALVEYQQVAATMAQGGHVGGTTADAKRGGWAALALTADADKLAATRAQQATMDNPDLVYADKMQGAILMAASMADPKAANPGMLYQQYQEYKRLEKMGSQFAAQKYAGAGGRIMQAYDKVAFGQNPTPENIAVWFSRAVTEASQPEARMSEKRSKAVTQALTSGKLATAYNALPNDSFSNRNPKAVTDLIAPYIRDDLPDDAAVPLAVSQAHAAGKVSGLAGYYWPLLPGVTSFEQAMRKDGKTVASDEPNRAFDHAVSVYTDKAGISKVTSIGQLVDDKGDPQVYVMGMDSQDKLVTTFFKASEAAAAWGTRKALPSAPEVTNYGKALGDPRQAGQSPLEAARARYLAEKQRKQ